MKTEKKNCDKLDRTKKTIRQINFYEIYVLNTFVIYHVRYFVATQILPIKNFNKVLNILFLKNSNIIIIIIIGEISKFLVFIKIFSSRTHISILLFYSRKFVFFDGLFVVVVGFRLLNFILFLSKRVISTNYTRNETLGQNHVIKHKR